ncbi:MAG: F0F1 ATP synthase subunit alpha [Oscillospiraceae bacterium]|jgi:F-type H+-transporting ATPase subunit alpha|nr:F0F1 ATP synthase subunit alpha [Oscillospiraceae bacterium]
MKQAIVRSAAPLDEAARAEIDELLRSKFGADVRVTTAVEPALLGGYTVLVEGTLYDFSFAAHLRQLKARMAGERGLDTLRNRTINNLQPDEMTMEPEIGDYGRVQAVADDVVSIAGLPGIKYGELLSFDGGMHGLALELQESGVGAVLLSDGDVKPGAFVRGTGRVVSVPVGPELLGRVIDPLGTPLDGKDLKTEKTRPVEAPAPSIMDRAPVSRPLMTGLIAIDAMIPIGRGQRELIIGDRQTGKTSIALAAMLAQKKGDCICIYVAIGQKASTVAQVVAILEKAKAMENTIIVTAAADDRATLQYLAPYAGCAIAEEFMHQGRDVLIVYDDLSKHAQAYRSMSLLLRRPSGREAYPGDVFYLHSRLLERAAQLSEEKGGGSITALPIIETMAGDISAYIPTNVISITDGQIFLNSDLFNAGLRPAVDVGLSVSRVGRAAQKKAMRDVSGSLRLDLAQYRDTAVFAQFGADLDASTLELLHRGERLTQLLKQRQDNVLELSEQTAVLAAFADGLLNGVEPRQMPVIRGQVLEYLHRHCNGTLHAIDASGQLSAGDRGMIGAYVKRFMAGVK